VSFLVILRIATLVAFLLLALRLFPSLSKVSASFASFRNLFVYGGWITISTIVAPTLVYLDRFLIGSILSIAALTYYTPPYEAVTRLGIFPASLAMTLFPAFSALEGTGDRDRLGTLFARSVKLTFFALVPMVLGILLFAEEILTIWLGADFPAKSSPVMRVFALGVLLNSLSVAPYALLQGIGRPDLTAKFHVIELIFYVGTAWILVTRFGIVGAAVAWSLRVGLDAVLLFAATFRVCHLTPRIFGTRTRLIATGMAISVIAALVYGVKNLASAPSLLMQTLLLVLVLGLSALLVWKNILDPSDRGVLLRVVKR